MNSPTVEKPQSLSTTSKVNVKQESTPIRSNNLPTPPSAPTASPAKPNMNQMTKQRIITKPEQKPTLQPLQKQHKPNPVQPQSHPQPHPHAHAQPQRQAIAPKFHKIQPAIAPKPMSSHQPSKFNPIPTGKLSISMNSSALAADCSLNTSRKWVLPPRPRPGRKPTHDTHGNLTDDTKKVTKSCPTPKKKPKCKKEPEPKSMNPPPSNIVTPALSQTGTPSPSNGLTPISTNDGKKSTPSTSVSDTPISTKNTTPEIPIPPAEVDPAKKLLDMKTTYLTKLKEQELIRNYIEVLTSQINELSFIQNGVITFDALKSSNKPQTTTNNTTTTTTTTNNNPLLSGNSGNGIFRNPVTTSSSPSATPASVARYDQLEAINNLNDLNKFLTYLTKSSNIINSVKKNNGTTASSETIDKQIDHYLEIRNKFKAIKRNEKNGVKTLNNLGLHTSFKANDEKISSIFSGTTFQDDLPSDSDFVPNLLKPIKASNLFQEYQSPDLQLQTETIEEASSVSNSSSYMGISKIVEDQENLAGDLFMDEYDFINRLVLEDRSREEEVFGNVVIHDKNAPTASTVAATTTTTTTTTTSNDNESNKSNDMIIKKKLKFNCGFCTNDTPCLCFDTMSPDK
ncbi:hypothetical protein G210_5327 [Candida maltosa Xu316]|uniref:Hap4 transcription factor heteromerisation domain-containing protein n=1 Tax=Candida maltosa (strain Xu316) TaxID=1245528 RepID=M3K6Y7_CANMX|nr:hypothetical protein G210_5327 [Candida maltosa Xu316]